MANLTFTVHTLESAPEASLAPLRALQQTFGMLPNVAGAIAGSPVLLRGFAAVFDAVHSGSFSEGDIQVLLLTNAVTNTCAWAVAFHSHLALQLGVPQQTVSAIREGTLPRDPRHAALSRLARELIEQRGHLNDDRIASFLRAGFEQQHVLEAILVSAASTITNYTGSVTRIPLEAAFQAQAWQR